MTSEQEKAVEPTLEPLLQAHIGKQLRTLFDAMTREPVPDRFKQLLDQLEAEEGREPSLPDSPRPERPAAVQSEPPQSGPDDVRAGADEAGAA